MTEKAPARLAMNQATVPRWTTPELIEGCARAGYAAVGLWRDRVAETGTEKVARIAGETGMQVSTLCRGGWFCATGPDDRARRMDDNRRAVDEAAVLGAATLVLVCGPATNKDLEQARTEVTDAIMVLAEYAAGGNVRLAIEPLHPLYCGDRSVVVTLKQALEIGRSAEPPVGVVLDSYHLWWDPSLEPTLPEAAGRVESVQLADWLAPPPDHLNGRGMLGQGSIDLRRFVRLVDELTGYRGPIEVEIFNPDVWAIDPPVTLQLVADAYETHVA
jgi:sugar phosphate isomerase/epimerase